MSVALRFRPANRVRRGSDFQRAYSTGNRARSRDLLVVVVPNQGQVTRLGLSVGKRVWKSAVKRNRVRRVFREAFRLALPQLPVGVDVIMIPGRPALEANALAISRDLLRLVPKALARYDEKSARRTPPQSPRPRGEAAR